jgi:signal transduction histidine kinase
VNGFRSPCLCLGSNLVSAGVNFANWQVETLLSLLDAVLAEDSVARAAHVRAALATEPEFARFASEFGLNSDGEERQTTHFVQELLARFSGEVSRDDAIPPAQRAAFARLRSALGMRSRVEHLLSGFTQALDEAKLTALAEFAAGAGHEMNNPLAVISGRAQLLLRGETDEARRADLALIKAQATRVHEMIADLMLFARPPAPVIQKVEIGPLVRETIERVRAAADLRGVQINTMYSEPMEISIDPAQISAALRGLIENALNAVSDGGIISIEVQGTTIVVRDSGPGITPEERGLIFDPYYSGRQAGRGLGMGLPKCWRIIQQHGGELRVQAAQGGGTEFVVQL